MIKFKELIEKNVPTKPALWSKYKSQAKAKFDVYPSAFANGWAAKQYKAAGGGWKSVSEELSEETDEYVTIIQEEGEKKKVKLGQVTRGGTKKFYVYVKNDKGNVVNIIDQRVEKLTPFFFSYTLSKSSLATLTKTSAMKLAPNIRVNAVSPGPTLKNKRQSEKHFKKQWKSTILEKKVDTKNVSSAVKFLINNNNITGQIINVDSGQRLAWKTPDIINAKE